MKFIKVGLLVPLFLVACTTDVARFSSQESQQEGEEPESDAVSEPSPVSSASGGHSALGSSFMRGVYATTPEKPEQWCLQNSSEPLVAYDGNGCVTASLCQAVLDSSQGWIPDFCGYGRVFNGEWVSVNSVMITSDDGLVHCTLPCETAADCPEFLVCAASTNLATGLAQPKQCLLPYSPQGGDAMGGAAGTGESSGTGEADESECMLDACLPPYADCQADTDCCDDFVCLEGVCKQL